ncbi:MAG TPA: efflux RND transporter periplasmic adaptor subunit, partial [Blastocatellia bacterium]|nr:efflux RND transporter periplasmic adaptor subunit [Blastocatellia bacterium]
MTIRWLVQDSRRLQDNEPIGKERIEVEEKTRAKAKDSSAPFDEGATDQEPSEPSSWRSRSTWLIGAGLFIGVLLLVLWISGQRAKSEAEEKEPVVVSVRVAKAERGPISAEVTAIGTIVPKEVATISPKINAQIKSMALLRNKAVRAGDVIATLEARDIQAQRAEAAAALEEAEANSRLVSGSTIPETASQDEKALRVARANVANALATLERRRALYDKGGISKKDLEASQLALTMAESDLRVAETAVRLHEATANPSNRQMAASKVKQAQDRLAALDTQLSYATIRAPLSGIITEQFQFEGEYAAAGAKLLTIADVSEVIVKAPFADNVAAQLKPGDPAKILPQDQQGEEITGRITLISRAADPQNRTVEVWVNLKNQDGRLRAAGAAKMVVSTNTESDAVIVPASAVTLEATNAEEGTVMVVDEKSIAHETKVTVGIRTGDRVQILSGL